MQPLAARDKGRAVAVGLGTAPIAHYLIFPRRKRGPLLCCGRGRNPFIRHPSSLFARRLCGCDLRFQLCLRQGADARELVVQAVAGLVLLFGERQPSAHAIRRVTVDVRRGRGRHSAGGPVLLAPLLAAACCRSASDLALPVRRLREESSAAAAAAVGFEPEGTSEPIEQAA